MIVMPQVAAVRCTHHKHSHPSENYFNEKDVKPRTMAANVNAYCLYTEMPSSWRSTVCES